MRAGRKPPTICPSRPPDVIRQPHDLEDKMRSAHNWPFRPIAICMVLWLMFPASEPGMAAAQQPAPERPAASAPSQASPSAEDAAGSIIAANALPDTPEPVSLQAQAQGARDSSSQSSSRQQQPATVPPEPAQPVGTAAAPYEKTMGVAASRPAGAAIAPAKQKRVRTILISVGVIVAAGVAVGTVAGLSHASSSHP